MSRDNPSRDYNSVSAVVFDMETTALFLFLGGIMNNQMVKRRWFPYPYHTIPLPRPMGPPVCKDRPECEGCPYPAHGFICRSKDGTCMKVNMEKLWEARRKCKQS